MKPLPHHYNVTVTAEGGQAELRSPGLNALVSAPPAEFDGPGNQWSPETLLVGAVGDCFVWTFTAIAATARLKWSRIACDVKGTLDRAEDGARFTAVQLNVRLEVPMGSDLEKARRLLEKADRSCLIGNSLKVRPELRCDVAVEEVPHALAG